MRVESRAAAGDASAGFTIVGVVAIGRNEGERLCRCLDSLPPSSRIVYVDSASTDDSVALALRRGAEVVELDTSTPFTAARARNAGFIRLRERWPQLGLVQFVDGDCALAQGWLESAIAELMSSPQTAIVCGRRRELEREASIYNRLCDMEWETPVGYAESCGGDALARVEAILQVGGFDDHLISGEEPEMCARLRGRGWRIRRIDADMTWHDAAMRRFNQWWRRSLRAGHGYAQVGALHPAVFRRQRRSSMVWAMLLPLGVLSMTAWKGPAGLLLLLGYPALGLRILLRRLGRDGTPLDSVLYAAFCVLGKVPEAAGIVKYWWSRVRGRRTLLIEYK